MSGSPSQLEIRGLIRNLQTDREREYNAHHACPALRLTTTANDVGEKKTPMISVSE